MTVENSNLKNQYTANGSTTVFDYEFIIFDQTHLKVVETDSDGNKTTAVLGSDYTVAGVGDLGGGSITYLVAPVSGTRLTLRLNVPLTQLVDYIVNDNFPSDSHESALDKITNVLKQVTENVERCIQYQEDEDVATTGETPVLNDRLDKLLAFDPSTGEPVTDITASNVSALLQANVGSILNTITDYGSVTETVELTADYGDLT